MILKSHVIVVIFSIITGGEIILACTVLFCLQDVIFRNIGPTKTNQDGSESTFFVCILKYFKKYVSYDRELVRSTYTLSARKSFNEPLE